MRARKRFGQHFLADAWARKLADAIEPRANDVFLEIGPGRGALTIPLAERARRLVAIEIDRDLAAALRPALPPHVELVTADVLAIDPALLFHAEDLPARVVGNLPYNISSAVLFRLLEGANAGRFFSDATLMLQREVADRLAAGPGGRDYGLLSIFTQLHADVRRLFTLPPGAFRPAPKVTSAVVRLSFRPPRVAVPDEALFSAVVRALFGQRRKTAANAIRAFSDARGVSAPDALAKAGIVASRGPETLELEELAALAAVFSSASRTDVL